LSKVNLIALQTQNQPVTWPLGSVFSCLPEPKALAKCLAGARQAEEADAWLIWDAALKLPDPGLILSLLGQSVDVWHAGLALGLAGKPEMIDFVWPTWMLNRDPDSTIEATSWRLSLRACLVRSDVLCQLGGPRGEFESLEAAGLELGFRYIRKGAFVRHAPGLVAAGLAKPLVDISIHDQLLFLRYSFGQRWLRWAVFRSTLTRFAKLSDLVPAWRRVRKLPAPEAPAVFQREEPLPANPAECQVSVLIPTLRRYPYLRMVLDQLRTQTVPPFEVLVVDQTPLTERDQAMETEFADLPIRWFFLDQAGQCSSRNFGLQQARGDAILFVDDDDEIQPDLIQKHLQNLQRFQTDISCGVAEETGSGELPVDFRFMRISDVFPTNNTLIRKRVLCHSGLFDLAYDHGQRADHDLGMRLYLAGDLMILDPDIRVIHHHAPMGGLREHKARVMTYAASRSKLFTIALPSVSDLYLSMRYFTPRQQRERLWIDVLGTFSVKGSAWKRMLKVVIGVVSLPSSIYRVNKRAKAAQQMLVDFPQIPGCPEEVL